MDSLNQRYQSCIWGIILIIFCTPWCILYSPSHKVYDYLKQKIYFHQQPHIVYHSKFASFAAQIRYFSLYGNFQKLTKKLGPDMNIFLENHTLFGHSLLRFHWKCKIVDQVRFTTNVTSNKVELEYHILLHMCMHINFSRNTSW